MKDKRIVRGERHGTAGGLSGAGPIRTGNMCRPRNAHQEHSRQQNALCPAHDTSGWGRLAGQMITGRGGGDSTRQSWDYPAMALGGGGGGRATGYRGMGLGGGGRGGAARARSSFMENSALMS